MRKRDMDRRSFIKTAALASGAALTGWSQANAASSENVTSQGRGVDADRDIAGASIAQLQARMAAGRLSSAELVDIYLRRIAAIDKGLDLRSIVQLNPDARRIALQLDQERRRKGPRGPLHGIPILLKDNIDTADRLQTTAGSLALAGASALQDATVAKRLRDAGAIILGKSNLS